MLKRTGPALVAVVALSLLLVPAGIGMDSHHKVTHYKGWSAPDSWCSQNVWPSYMRNCIKAQRVIYTVFPKATRVRAMGVAKCETGNTFIRWATNRSSGTAGLFQIHPGNHGTTWYWSGGSSVTIDSSRLYNSWYNARVALYMSKGGTDWGQWAPVCRR